MELLSPGADYEGLFLDKRLAKRASLISQSLLQSKSSSIRRATKDKAQQKGF
ncbi:MAG: transposase DNA-binding-containing protein [Ferruginibacter sp.]